MKKSSPIEHKGYFAKRFLVVSLIIIAILSLVFVLGLNLIVNDQKITIQADQNRKVHSDEGYLEYLLNDAVLDLKVMTNSQLFQSFFSENKANSPYKKDFDNLMKDLFIEKASYYQIRFLDSLGMEVYRVERQNGQPRICDKSELQDKSKRYYFQEGIKLKRGNIYISPFDLNIEHDKIEQPFRPMIRICVPAFGDDNTIKGVNILNYDGSQMLNEIEQDAETGLGNSYLINSEGYFLHSPDTSQEWGFMFPEKKDVTIRTVFPQDYEKIMSEKSGQFETGNGLYSIAEVIPFQKLGDETYSGVRPRDYSWKLISFIPREELSWAAFIPMKKAAFLYLFTLIGGLILAYLYSKVSLRRRQAQFELAESEKNLRNANETKDRFFSIISHDLKNASGTIAYYLEFMKDQYKAFSEEEIKMHLFDVAGAAMQHNKLLHDILAWAKLQQGRAEFNPEVIALDEIMADQKAIVDLNLKNKELELVIDIEDGAQVYADKEMVKTIFRNLINNAIKFSHRSSSIEIIVRKKVEQVEIRVIDHGIGMRPEDASKILKLDSKIQQKGTENEEGTGFGLKMVGELVKKNGGSAKVESAIGQGASFILSFPSGKEA